MMHGPTHIKMFLFAYKELGIRDTVLLSFLLSSFVLSRLFSLHLFLGAFTKLCKATISFVMSSSRAFTPDYRTDRWSRNVGKELQLLVA